MKKGWLFIVALVVLVVTNPSLEKHQERVYETLLVQLDRDAGDGLGGAFIRWTGINKISAGTVASSVGRKDLLICSIGLFDGKAATFGILGCVIIL